jgi:uncharacterized RDD family membrane protein YckC
MREDLEYVGFWPRVGAGVIDTLLCLSITLPIIYVMERSGQPSHPIVYIADWGIPFAFVMGFWLWRQATPGKMAISSRIVDSRTGLSPELWQWLVRYAAYFLSILPFGMGCIWVAFDERRRGWHDMLARTVVVRPKDRGVRPVGFGSE